MSTAALLEDIAAFLAATGMSKTAFGIRVMKNSKFITDLERGKQCYVSTAERVRAFIKQNGPQIIPAATGDWIARDPISHLSAVAATRAGAEAGLRSVLSARRAA